MHQELCYVTRVPSAISDYTSEIQAWSCLLAKEETEDRLSSFHFIHVTASYIVKVSYLLILLNIMFFHRCEDFS